MNNKVTKYDWIELSLLLLVALCFSLPPYVESAPPFVLIIGALLYCVLPLYYILTYKKYSLRDAGLSSRFVLVMYLVNFLYKNLVLLTFVLSFTERGWVGLVTDRSMVVNILFIVNRLIMIPYFIICLRKKAYKEAGVAFVYDAYYQFLAPVLTFFMFH